VTKVIKILQQKNSFIIVEFAVPSHSSLCHFQSSLCFLELLSCPGLFTYTITGAFGLAVAAYCIGFKMIHELKILALAKQFLE